MPDYAIVVAMLGIVAVFALLIIGALTTGAVAYVAFPVGTIAAVPLVCAVMDRAPAPLHRDYWVSFGFVALGPSLVLTGLISSHVAIECGGWAAIGMGLSHFAAPSGRLAQGIPFALWTSGVGLTITALSGPDVVSLRLLGSVALMTMAAGLLALNVAGGGTALEELIRLEKAWAHHVAELGERQEIDDVLLERTDTYPAERKGIAWALLRAEFLAVLFSLACHAGRVLLGIKPVAMGPGLVPWTRRSAVSCRTDMIGLSCAIVLVRGRRRGTAGSEPAGPYPTPPAAPSSRARRRAHS